MIYTTLMPDATCRQVVAILIALSILAVPLSWAMPKLYWRAQLVSWKFTGPFRGVPWSNILAMVRPFGRQGDHSLHPAFDTMVSRRTQDARPVLRDTALGPFWGRASDGEVLYSTIHEMVFERGRERSAALLQANGVVLDVGSHVGIFTRHALRRGARLVVAIEPEPISVACFRKTFRDELDQGRVVLVEAATWEISGTLEISLGDDGLSWGFSAIPVLQSKNASKLAVRATTIDETVEQLKLSKVDFVKINIEGSETHALQGARRTVGAFRPRMDISIHHLDEDVKMIPQLVLDIRPDYRISFNHHFSEAFFY